MRILRWVGYMVASAGILMGLLSIGAFVAMVVFTLMLIAAGGCAILFVAFLIKEWYEGRLKAKQENSTD